MHDLPKSSGTQPEYVVVLELHALTFVLYVVPLGQLLLPPEEDDPELDPVHVPVVVQLVQVLLPALVYRVLQLEQEVTVPPLKYVPEEQAVQTPFFR